VRAWAVSLSIVAGLGCSACGSGSTGGSNLATSSSRSQSSSTTSTATTTTSTTTPAPLPGAGKPQITIGDKNYTEQFVLGELYQQALQAQGFIVQLDQNIGPTAVTLQALQTGSLAMYPEYLNVFDSSIAHDTRNFPSRHAAYSAARRYAATHGLELLAPTPFSDTTALGVTLGYAQANQVRSLRDLARVSAPVTVGGPPQFQTGSPGLPTIEHVYGVHPSAFTTLAVGAQYTALNDGTVQAAYVGTTDGQLASGDYEILSDPRHLFGWGNAVPVVSASAATAEGPVFVSTIDRVSALLTMAVMRRLNQAVDVAGQAPSAVATQFLETRDLIPPASH
jgi:osmoprotectant transport system substrate-binding protein